MDIVELAVPDAYRITPTRRPDERGVFHETMRARELAAATGRRFPVAQANHSVSRRGVLRGLHGVAVPPGQAKYVSCLRGAVLDIVVDVRVGSPAYGTCAVNRLDAGSAVAVFVAEGLAHGFVALTDGATVGYLCSTAYEDTEPYELNPLDPDLALPWGCADPILSAKDRAAPTLAEAAAAGLLPTFRQCRDLYAAADALA
ncbi:dTDP-4-dehydrorhamnose 3,5-epimerase family protein [Virgisporangium aurantiacum]|uniref:dTDP-4-dehydrorhamnose 3,5-epimerase n=1 Tax=Virgisporangium aurantiacum TaxID=175570 RepID=A0A8J4E3X1_9ACTN|nr:dTDP-4-dehydrorhamnose 3,5-epimerase family protein [Virgisporangium aurantiacum]GIJ60388.1 dTDP-4-dehydrorhamnose 3,5-epimerase [Virgisporangium aurantiacum]